MTKLANEVGWPNDFLAGARDETHFPRTLNPRFRNPEITLLVYVPR